MIIGISGKIGSGKDTVAGIICRLQTVNPDWEIRKFAGKLKLIVSVLTGVPLDALDTEEGKNYILTPDWDKHFVRHWGKRINRIFDTRQDALDFCTSKNNSQHEFDYDGVEQLTIRRFLQLMGTECIRDIIHPNAHINALFVDYDNYFHARKFSVRQGITKPEYPNWIITDVRFPNEAKAIRDKGGILIRVDSSYINVRDGKTIRFYPEGGEHISETALDTYNEWNCRILNDGTIENLVEVTRKVLQDYERLRLGNYSK